ncbi:hypothetical protein, partial [Corynebacterium variabile]|uniref:hypothetical protein n=1 Tax=Corynebacterium variabile TaxID=1727 RepID=UPI003BB14E36
MATDKSWVVINLETSKYPGTTGVFHVRDKAEALELADLLSMLGCRAYWHSPGYYPEDLFDNVDDEAQFKLSPVSDGLGQALSNPDVASPQKVGCGIKSGPLDIHVSGCLVGLVPVLLGLVRGAILERGMQPSL